MTRELTLTGNEVAYVTGALASFLRNCKHSMVERDIEVMQHLLDRCLACNPGMPADLAAQIEEARK